MARKKTSKSTAPVTEQHSESLDKDESGVIVAPSSVTIEETQLSQESPIPSEIEMMEDTPRYEIVDPIPVETMAKKWNELFSNDRERSEASELKYVPPAVKNRTRVVSFNSKDLVKEEEKWKFAIIVINSFIRNRWAKFGLRNVVRINGSMFMFEFGSEEECNKVLGDGPYTFDQKPLMLKKWQPRMSMDPNNISFVPVWIQLPGLPWEFWTADMLSKIGSIYGNPLYSDQCTISKAKLNFARVLVEMEVAGLFPESMELQDEFGNVFNQKIVYEWRPLFCDKCCKMGHAKKNCKVNQDIRKAMGKKKNLKMKVQIQLKQKS
ncbi:uncharacterized protein LOC126657166 [Mercurialis annua]|uniref:uncharacterized protein LOC126657166 n=1 Tax=Mercurialis annua TaxID=3986 RepID=UPI00215FC682|nr:uncharacterized protein LOC126657166 [Mercurialis annua]